MARLSVGLALVGFLLAAALAPALAQPSPAQRFTANMAEVKATLEDFNKTVIAYNAAIGEITAFDVAAAKRQVEEIRRSIEALVAQIGDDSDLARSQLDLAQWIDRNRRRVRADPLLGEERKAYLLKEWEQRALTISVASQEIGEIRRALRDQLTSVMGDETYLSQLIMLEKADEAAVLVRSFLDQVKDFAEVLQRRLRLVPVPTS